MILGLAQGHQSFDSSRGTFGGSSMAPVSGDCSQGAHAMERLTATGIDMTDDISERVPRQAVESVNKDESAGKNILRSAPQARNVLQDGSTAAGIELAPDHLAYPHGVIVTRGIAERVKHIETVGGLSYRFDPPAAESRRGHGQPADCLVATGRWPALRVLSLTTAPWKTLRVSHTSPQKAISSIMRQFPFSVG